MRKKKITKEIESSRTFKAYSALVRLSNYVPTYKWILGVAFVIGALDFLADDQVSVLGKIILVGVWTPALIFALVGGVIHFLTGIKIRSLQKKYDLSKEEVLKEIELIKN